MAPLAIVDPVVPPPRGHVSNEVLAERIETSDEAREASSRRLHLEIKELRERFERHLANHGDVTNLRFSPTVTVAIVAGVLTLFGTLYSLSRDIEAVMKEQRLNGIKIEALTLEAAKGAKP